MLFDQFTHSFWCPTHAKKIPVKKTSLMTQKECVPSIGAGLAELSPNKNKNTSSVPLSGIGGCVTFFLVTYSFRNAICLCNQLHFMTNIRQRREKVKSTAEYVTTWSSAKYTRMNLRWRWRCIDKRGSLWKSIRECLFRSLGCLTSEHLYVFHLVLLVNVFLSIGSLRHSSMKYVLKKFTQNPKSKHH